MHWAVQYLGKPWQIDGFGPESFNCWGLVWWIYRRHYATELPQYAGINPKDTPARTRAFTTASGAGDWLPLAAPADGCVVGLSAGRLIHHVGIFLAIDGGLVLHACDGKGVLCQSLPALRASGFNRISFYQHSSWPQNLPASSK